MGSTMTAHWSLSPSYPRSSSWLADVYPKYGGTHEDLPGLDVAGCFRICSLIRSFGLWAKGPTVTYNFPESFSISLPTTNPCCTYSWGITSLNVDPSITGQNVTVSKISVSGLTIVSGAPTGGFDWIVLVGSTPFGFPTSGQIFVNSTTDPFLLSPTAPVEFHFAEQPGGSTVINGSFDFPTNAFTTPCCGVNRLVSANASPINVTSGLYVQMLLYTGDPNTNMAVSNLQVTLTLSSCDLGLPDSLQPFPNGPLSRSLNATSMGASFTPTINGVPVSLSTAAAACGFTGFDWQQTIDKWPAPSNPSECALIIGPPKCLAANSAPATVLTAPPSFYDPPISGYTYFSFEGFSLTNPFYQANPFYYNPALVPTECAVATANGGCSVPITSIDGNTRTFSIRRTIRSCRREDTRHLQRD